MKCKKCGGKAAINMPQHRLGLCKEHFLDWLPEQTERFIKKYSMFTHDERVLVAVSGGKDSLSLWDILHRLDYQADGLYLCLGIDEGRAYSSESQRLAEEFSEIHGLTLYTVNIQAETGKSIPELTKATARGREKPCSVCGMVKRHELNRFARQHGYNVLATGHNLDDEAAILFGNTLRWQEEYLLRQSPVLTGTEGLIRKVKPLCHFYERDMTAYALLRGIVYVYEECPFASGAPSIYYKEILNQMENHHPGMKLNFYLNFLRARKKGLFVEKKEINQEIVPCPDCGQPITTGRLCSYCRMLETIP